MLGKKSIIIEIIATIKKQVAKNSKAKTAGTTIKEIFLKCQ